MTTALSLGYLDELGQVSRFIQDLSAKDAILTDVLWSDPTTEPGLTENNRGDAGLLWGPDCTEAFLEQSKLKVIIRSHEGPDSIACQKALKNMLEGYSTDHEVGSGKLYTLFSAPDYPQASFSFAQRSDSAAMSSGADQTQQPREKEGPNLSINNLHKQFCCK